MTTDKTTNRLIKITLAVVLASAFFYATGQVFFIVFAGLLVAIFFDAIVRAMQYLFISTREYAAALTLFLFFAAIGLFLWLGYGELSNQFTRLLQTVPSSLSGLQDQFSEWPRVQAIIGEAANVNYNNLLGGSGSMLVSGLLAGLATLIAIFFIGVYIAFEPSLYKRGSLALFPEKYHGQVKHILDDAENYLRWWLVGKFISMSFVGVITALGMWWLGVPLPVLLGVIAAVLTFVPNLGPVFSAVPAILLGLTQSVNLALYVVVFYLLTQVVESYILTPFIERRAVYLPPVLTLTAQILLGLWFGLVGVSVAAPLVVVAMVFVDSLYTHKGVYESPADQ